MDLMGAYTLCCTLLNGSGKDLQQKDPKMKPHIETYKKKKAALEKQMKSGAEDALPATKVPAPVVATSPPQARVAAVHQASNDDILKLKREFMALATEIAQKEKVKDWKGASQLTIKLVQTVGQKLKSADPQMAIHVEKWAKKYHFFQKQLQQQSQTQQAVSSAVRSPGAMNIDPAILQILAAAPQDRPEVAQLKKEVMAVTTTFLEKEKAKDWFEASGECHWMLISIFSIWRAEPPPPSLPPSLFLSLPPKKSVGTSFRTN
jgi:hypothetical protein